MKTFLIVDASDPAMLLNAAVYGADGLIFDLEQAAPGERDAARLLLGEALAALPYRGAEILVRVDACDGGETEAELGAIASLGPDAFVVFEDEGRLVRRASPEGGVWGGGEVVARAAPGAAAMDAVGIARAAMNAGFPAFATHDAGLVEAIGGI
ncbi:MAG: hypothetical protein LBS32_00995 [Clostridiales Family XIII bacterium]|jgi:hypothetical protein|nr:hypothetical protein [Clostridiales Family XIII bacterium]